MPPEDFIACLLGSWIRDHPEDRWRSVSVVVPRALRRMALQTGATTFVHTRTKAGKVLRVGVLCPWVNG